MSLDRRGFVRGIAGATTGLLLPTIPTFAADDAIRIDADFPGGNIKLVKMDGDTAHVETDLRDTQKGQWWFYWCFRLRAPAGKAIRVVFTDKNPIGVRGPAVSVDGGVTWKWMGAKAVREEKANNKSTWSFEAAVPEGKTEVRYAFCIPYLQSDLKSFLNEFKNNPAIKVEEMCKSRKDRSVELIRAGCLDLKKSKGTIILTSRHHACEALATYAMEGFLRAVLADDDLGKKWRENWEVIAIPFMDKDGVESGDQGKNRTPHDHNRDYNEKPIHPEVSALMKLGTSIQTRVLVSLDLHCPHIRGEWNDRVYIVGSSKEKTASQQVEFAKTLERVRTGSIKFRARDCLAFGTSWNTNNNHTQGRPNAIWASDTFTKAKLTGTIEIAYADALGDEVNAESARALGKDIAKAIAEMLDQK